jgi:hypothetical protein
VVLDSAIAIPLASRGHGEHMLRHAAPRIMVPAMPNTSRPWAREIHVFLAIEFFVSGTWVSKSHKSGRMHCNKQKAELFDRKNNAKHGETIL